MIFNLKNDSWFLIILVVILMLPLLAMQFTSEVNWSFADFLLAAALLSISYFVGKYIVISVKNWPLKIVFVVVLFLILLLLWVELAVGIFDSFFAGS